MSFSWQAVVTGLSAGSLYALVAIGLVLVWRSSRVLNFGHGDVSTLGTFVAFSLVSAGLPFGLAVLAGMAAGALVSVLFYFGAVAPAQRRDASHAALMILTLGLGQLVHAVVLGTWRAEPERFPFPVSETATLKLGPIYVGHLSLVALAVGLVGSLGLYWLVQHTRLGLALRAISEDRPAAQTLGIPTRSVLAFAWGGSAALGVGAGVVLAGQLLLDPFFMLDPFLKGFAAATLGGLNSLPGAVVGGLVLGAAEGILGSALGVEFRNSLAFLVIVLVLLIRPEGLLGKEFKERV